MKPIDGMELYKKMRDIDKKVKVFVFTVTDPTFEELKKICASFEERYLIRKPISLWNLFQFVRQALA
jgi:hypothetical protein